jgi:hypothetical protein
LNSLDLSLVKSQNSKAYVFDVGDRQVPERRVLWAISQIKPIFSTFIVFVTSIVFVTCTSILYRIAALRESNSGPNSYRACLNGHMKDCPKLLFLGGACELGQFTLMNSSNHKYVPFQGILAA